MEGDISAIKRRGLERRSKLHCLARNSVPSYIVIYVLSLGLVSFNNFNSGFGDSSM